MVNCYEVMKEIEIEFFDRLNQKTGWGKEEAKRLYKDTVRDVLMKKLMEEIDE